MVITNKHVTVLVQLLVLGWIANLFEAICNNALGKAK
jgi:hypothetical protein